MSGPGPDPRLNAWRDDLADARLRGQVKAARFVEGTPARVTAGIADLKRAPAADAPGDSQLLMGEPVTVFEEAGGGWAWVQSRTDGYVGWCRQEALGRGLPEPGHRVAALWLHLYPVPDIKVAPTGFAPMNALLAVVGRASGVAGLAGGAGAGTERFVQLADGRFAVARHLVPAGETGGDFVAAARRFLGTPYLWAGRSARGIDCSGLVQMALAACGRPAPRDSDMQAQGLGSPVHSAAPESWRRGDLVFWKGHVGIVAGDNLLLHANAYHMECAEEPLLPAIERIAGAGLDVTGVRRLDQ